jgi:hypothetical protein
MIGRFKARGKEAQFGVSSNGNEQVAVLFEITEGEHTGKSLTWFGSFTEAAIDRTMESLRHCGWTSDNITDACVQIGDNDVEIDVREEEYQGKLQTKVAFVNRPFRLAMKAPMNANEIASFAARMKGKAVASKKAYGAPATPAHGGPQRGNGQRQNARTTADDFPGNDAGYSDDDF